MACRDEGAPWTQVTGYMTETKSNGREPLPMAAERRRLTSAEQETRQTIGTREAARLEEEDRREERRYGLAPDTVRTPTENCPGGHSGSENSEEHSPDDAAPKMPVSKERQRRWRLPKRGGGRAQVKARNEVKIKTNKTH